MRLRLVALLILLCLAIVAWKYVDRHVAPLIERPTQTYSGPPRPLTAADKEKLKVLQTDFMNERDTYLKLKYAGAPADQVAAQYERVTKLIQAVEAIGGIEAIRTLPRSKYAPTSKPGGNRNGAGPGGGGRGR